MSYTMTITRNATQVAETPVSFADAERILEEEEQARQHQSSLPTTTVTQEIQPEQTGFDPEYLMPKQHDSHSGSDKRNADEMTTEGITEGIQQGGAGSDADNRTPNRRDSQSGTNDHDVGHSRMEQENDPPRRSARRSCWQFFLLILGLFFSFLKSI
jgi:hypothetical protein